MTASPGNVSGWVMDDFKAFYCAGAAVRSHESPYATGSIGKCEAAPAAYPLFVARAGFVLPAPLPGYAMLPFAILTAVSFDAASILWLIVLSASSVAAFWLMSRLELGDVWKITLAFAFPLVAISFTVGEIVPIALLGIVLAARAARCEPERRSQILLAIGIALSFVEPQVGIAVAVACALLGPRFTATSAVVVCVLGAVSFAAIGLAANIAYVREVVPAHILSELPAYFQYSLSWVLNQWGVPAQSAILAGRLQWIAMLGLTAWFARSALARTNHDLAVLAAAAFAVTGGPFLHLDHTALALPAALWLVTRSPSRPLLHVAALVALALPLLHLLLLVRWISPPLLILSAAIIAGWLGVEYGGFRFGAYLAVGAILFFSIIDISGVVTWTASIGPIAPADLRSQGPWAHFIAAHYALRALPIWLAKLPTWFGIVATAASLVAAAWGYGKRKQLSGAVNYAT
jgi:hypothetical protein